MPCRDLTPAVLPAGKGADMRALAHIVWWHRHADARAGAWQARTRVHTHLGRELVRVKLLVNDASRCRHPLHIAGPDHVVVAYRVAVLNLALEGDGDGLEPAVRVLCSRVPLVLPEVAQCPHVHDSVSPLARPAPGRSRTQTQHTWPTPRRVVDGSKTFGAA
jgi:hypothetical protein